MFSEMKGSVEQQLQPITSTPFDLQNGLRSQRDVGQHLRQHRADIHTYFWTKDHETSTCGLKQSNSPYNGYNHTNKQHLANQRGRVQLNLAGQSCQTEVTSTQKQPPGNRLQHNRVSVNYSLRECSVVIHQHQTGPHLSLRKCDLDPPAQFKGHRNCGLPVCVAEQQSVSVKESLLKKLNASDRVNVNEYGFDTHNSTFNSILCTCNEQRTLSRYLGHVMQDLNRASLVHKMMLSTKDASTTSQQINCQAKLDQDLSGPGGRSLSSKQSQRVIQDQIQNIVVNLEEVLQGLKEIHLEMKEVVQQIDLLTADIDMGEKDPGGTFSSKMGSGVQELESFPCEADSGMFFKAISEVGKETFCLNRPHPPCTDTPPVSPPAHPVRDQTLCGSVQQRGSTPDVVTSQRRESRTATGRRGKKPPPYPYTSTTETANPKSKAKGKKAPSYSFKRRLNSTIV